MDDPLLANLVEDFATRLQRGEAVEISAYVREHPDHAEPLRRLLPGVQVLAELGRSAGLGEAVPPLLGPEPGVLGDYRIVREVGRGGMGMVYEAEQISLQRRVALKVLPFAAVLDPRRLQRFVHEAQAAANLHHANVVPVFGVGCERGVHFYAMQFIDGHNLAALIQELLRGGEGSGVRSQESGREHRSTSPERQRREPPNPCPATQPAALVTERSVTSRGHFRMAAQLGIQAAEALEHAHQLGVIHRDVKPANLLVDGRSHLWVTDFGLAQVQGNPALTATGDLVGTLRYLSPEQALARRVPVDHRTDVYSLGATLYELLTLEPVFGGQDRQELLRQIAQDEPRPPRKLNQAIPADLETIVLKALRKEPAERYGTAQELADDLQRFLDHQPIRARRPTLWQRLAKWARRHRPLVAAAAVFLLLAVAGLVAATVLVWRAERRATAGWAEAQEAYEAEARQRAEAQKAYEAEARQRRRAEANMRLAWDAAERTYAQALEEWLANQPGLDEAPRRFLLDALAFYERFAAENGANPKLRRETAQAYSRVGRIHDRLGVPDEAEKAYRQAVDRQQALADEFPGEPGRRFDLAVSHLHWVDSLIARAHFTQAEKHGRRAQTLLQQLVKETPRSAQYRDEAARTYNALGTIARRTGRPREAEEQFDKSVALCRKLREEFPAKAAYRRGLAVALHNRGLCRQDDGQLREAEDDLRQSNDLKRRLVKEVPAVATYRADLANGVMSLGALLRQAGRLPEAEDAFREALPLWQRLAADFPRVHDLRHGLARGHHQLGRLLRARGQLPEAEREIGRALTVLQKLADEVPRLPVYRHDLALGHRDLGDVRRMAGRLAEAEPAFRRAQDLLQKLADEFPKTDLYRKALASAHNNLGGVLGELGRLDEALAVQRAALRVRRGLADEFPDQAEYRDSLASSLHNLADLLRRKGDRAGCVPLLREAIGHETAALAKRPRHAPYRDFLCHLHLFLADTQVRLGRHAEAAEAAAAAPRLDANRWQAAFAAAGYLAPCARLAAKDPALSEDARQGLAKAYADQTRSWLGEAARRTANDPKGLNDLAWLLASDTDPMVRDARRAVELAGQAVKQRPEVGAFRCTLGVAYYRAGEWRAAAEALEKAQAMLTGEHRCVSRFALAMACWQAGERERARGCYDQAVRDAKALSPPSRMAEGFRAEAAALLNSPNETNHRGTEDTETRTTEKKGGRQKTEGRKTEGERLFFF
jgi:serine/threonine protein kinase